MKTVAIICSLDTKAEDAKFIKEIITSHGYKPLVIDVGVLGDPPFSPDINADTVARLGGSSLEELRKKKDKGFAMNVMAEGVKKVVRTLFEQGKIDAVLAMGGSSGTAIGAAALQELPLGVPKVLLTTLAAGNMAPYVGTKDICVIHSVVDVAGLNSISARIYAEAAGAILGMLTVKSPSIEEKPIVVISMFGNTTPAVQYAKKVLEYAGFEILVFHATGTGGRIMESLVLERKVVGVLDMTTTELADELVGGVLSAGPERLEAAGKVGIPQVVVPGCMDMVNFWARDTVPPKFENRLFYQWNPNVTLMRTTPEENEKIGRWMAEKLNRAKGPVAVFLPKRGLSMLDAPGKEFWWPEADEALFRALKENLRPDIPVYEMDYNINDKEFAEATARELLKFLKGKKEQKTTEVV